jgi:hypothetical protein
MGSNNFLVPTRCVGMPCQRAALCDIASGADGMSFMRRMLLAWCRNGGGIARRAGTAFPRGAWERVKAPLGE